MLITLPGTWDKDKEAKHRLSSGSRMLRNQENYLSHCIMSITGIKFDRIEKDLFLGTYG
jgi:hypothetical protein